MALDSARVAYHRDTGDWGDRAPTCREEMEAAVSYASACGVSYGEARARLSRYGYVRGQERP